MMRREVMRRDEGGDATSGDRRLVDSRLHCWFRDDGSSSRLQSEKNTAMEVFGEQLRSIKTR